MSEIFAEIDRISGQLQVLSRDLDDLKLKIPIHMTPQPQPQPTNLRRSFGVEKLRIEVQKVSTPSKVWRLTDLWTTENGSWDLGDGAYSIPAWARNEFMSLFPMTGGDHNIYAIMLARTGENVARPVRDQKMRFWHNHGAFIKDAKPAGYFEQDIFGSFNPDDPAQRGGWSVAPSHPVADMVSGMGLPMNHHVSLFCVWRWLQ